MGLLAAAVKDRPAAIGIELMNEPPFLERGQMYQTWEACYDAVRAESDDIAVGVMDTGQAALGIGNLLLSKETVAWLKDASSKNGLFYAYHCYGCSPASAVKTAKNNPWGMPSLLTEYGGYGDGCDIQKAAKDQGVGSAYWHYSDCCWPKHCPGGLPDGHCPLEGERWGACITGWANGNSSFYCGITAP